MKRDKAIEIRQRALEGEQVTAGELQEAIFTLSKRRDKKLVLPDLPRPVKERTNAGLAFRLGLAIGRGRAAV